MPELFTCHLDWTGAANGPTRDVATLSQDLTVSCGAAPSLAMSGAPAYKGNPARLNPELLFVASLSTCQALTFLFLAARSGVVVTAYTDDPDGKLGFVDGRMRLSHVTLRPSIRLDAGADPMKARELVEKAHEQCFIANSVTTRITIEPTIEQG